VDGLIEGELITAGWGADLSYPGFRPRIGGDAVAVWVLRAPLLATAWPDLDRFEGEGYRRILVPVFSEEIGESQGDTHSEQIPQLGDAQYHPLWLDRSEDTSATR